jgi:hypothetical protein
MKALMIFKAPPDVVSVVINLREFHRNEVEFNNKIILGRQRHGKSA